MDCAGTMVTPTKLSASPLSSSTPKSPSDANENPVHPDLGTPTPLRPAASAERPEKFAILGISKWWGETRDTPALPLVSGPKTTETLLFKNSHAATTSADPGHMPCQPTRTMQEEKGLQTPMRKPKADQVVVSITALSLVKAAQSLRKCLNSFGLYFPSHWDFNVPCTHQHVPCELVVTRTSAGQDRLTRWNIDPSGLASDGCDFDLYSFGAILSW